MGILGDKTLNHLGSFFKLRKLILSLVCLSVLMLWTFQLVFFFLLGFFEKHKGTSHLLDVQQKSCKNNFPLSRTLIEQYILSLLTSFNLQEPSLNKISSLSFTTKYSEKQRRLFFREAAFQNNFL